MKFKHKLLSCAISFALGFASDAVYPAGPKPNTKPFALSTFTDTFISSANLAVNKTGKFLAVWSGLQQDKLTGKVKSYVYGRYTNQGAAVGNEIKIAESDDVDVVNYFILGQNTAVAMDTDGDAVVCWEALSLEAETEQISCRLVPKDSSANIETATIPVNALGHVKGLSVAMDADGNFIVAWNSYSADSESSAVMARRFAADGAAMADPFLVSENSSGWTVSVAMDQDGDALVAWESNGIIARRIDKNGSMPKDAFRVDKTPDDAFSASKNTTTSTEYSVGNPSVAMDDSGNFAVAWGRTQTNTKTKTKLIKGKCYKDEDGEQYCEDDEYVHLRSYSFAQGVFAQRFDVNGNAMNKNKKTQNEEDIVISFKKGKGNFSPDIAMDSIGNFIVSWDPYLTRRTCSTYEGENECDDMGIGSSVFARKFNSLKNKLEGVKSVIGKSKKSPYYSNTSVALIDDGSFEVGWISTHDNKKDDQYESKALAKFFPAKKK